jgi:hypothetical protein
MTNLLNLTHTTKPAARRRWSLRSNSTAISDLIRRMGKLCRKHGSFPAVGPPREATCRKLARRQVRLFRVGSVNRIGRPASFPGGATTIIARGLISTLMVESCFAAVLLPWLPIDSHQRGAPKEQACKLLLQLVPGEGFEPPTFGLQNRCTAPVLTRQT